MALGAKPALSRRCCWLITEPGDTRGGARGEEGGAARGHGGKEAAARRVPFVWIDAAPHHPSRASYQRPPQRHSLIRVYGHREISIYSLVFISEEETHSFFFNKCRVDAWGRLSAGTRSTSIFRVFVWYLSFFSDGWIQTRHFDEKRHSQTFSSEPLESNTV